MNITQFTDLADLVVLEIIRYLSPFDAIQAFHDVDRQTDQMINLLIEARCFSTIHQLRLPLFHFVCDDVLPLMGHKLSRLILYDHQLVLAREKQLLSYLLNLSSLHLINIAELTETETDLFYFLRKQLKELTIEFIAEHHIDAQAQICEQFIFHRRSENLIHCHLSNNYGIQLRRLTLFANHSIERMTIQLKQLADLHVLFDHLPNVKVLNVELCRWAMEDIKYDYTKLQRNLPRLIEFSLQVHHTLSFKELLTIIQSLIHLKKLSFDYRNYDEHGIDFNQLEFALTHLSSLRELHFIIKFIYFHLNTKLSFDSFKQRWSVRTFNNPSNKNYLAYTEPLTNPTFSISSDILLKDGFTSYPSVTNLYLTTHSKQLSLLPIMNLLQKNFPALTELHVVDSFGAEENESCTLKLPKITSLDGSELKISMMFGILFQSLPNLNHLRVNLNLLMKCDLQILFRNHRIKSLELITNHFDQVKTILIHFPALKQLTIDTKRQSKSYERKLFGIVLDWFEICTQMYTIHIKAHKLSDLFYLVQMESSSTMHVQYSNEMLTVWK